MLLLPLAGVALNVELGAAACGKGNGIQRTSMLSGDTEIGGSGGLTLGHFWAWAFSDVKSNLTRSVFAEFIVGSALGAVDRMRAEWEPHDLTYRGKGIEVKAAGFVHSWPQGRPSPVRFDISKRKWRWDSSANAMVEAGGRAADIYVFAVHAEQNRSRADPLDLEQWEFYPLSTADIESHFGDQKSVGLNRLRAIAAPVAYGALRAEIEKVLA